MFLPALIFLTATWRHGDATSCTAVTGNTCQKTSYLTGTCTNAVCACIEGFEPTRFGCVEKVKPIVTITASDGRSSEALSKGSGEVFVGGKIILYCVASRVGMTYVWSKDNVVISGQTTDNIILSSVNTNHSGQYRCRARLDISDYVSDPSEPVTVKVVPVNGTFGSQPVVIGMSKRAMLNSVITLECTNTPSGIGLTYEWFLGGASTNIRTRGYNLTATNQTVAKNVTCRIGQAPPAASAVLASPESAPVDTPSSLTDDISGATILQARGTTKLRAEVGFDVNLQCAISDTDLAVQDSTMTYTWTKNGTVISQTSTYSKTKLTAADAGVYQCSAQAGALPAKDSAPLSLEVVPEKEIVGSVKTEVVPIGNTPLLGGYMSIKCIVEVANLTKLNYLWRRTEAGFFSQQRDGQIQVNEVTSKDSGNYTCLVSTELVWGQSQTVVIKPPVTIDTVAPNAPTADKSDKDSFGVGNTYTLACSSSYDSPGLTYRWMEGIQVIAGATSKTYTITAKTGVTLYSCQIVFNGTASKSSPSLTIAAKNIIGLTVELAGTTVSGSTIKPLAATKVTLECKAKTAVSSSGSVAYAWLRNDQRLQDQTASTYEFSSGAASDGDIKCNATIGSEAILSDKVTVTSVAALEAPTLEVSNSILLSGQQVYSEGGTYILLCKTASHTDSVAYSWRKDGTVIGGSTGRSYTISNAKRGKDGDSGVYTCTATQGTSTVTSNPGITITIGEPGRPCKFVTECLGVQYGPSCVNSRCECSSGYTATGDTCKSDVTNLRASALLLMFAAITSWMLQQLF